MTADRGRALDGNRPLFRLSRALKSFPTLVTQSTGPDNAFLLETGDGAFAIEASDSAFGVETT